MAWQCSWHLAGDSSADRQWCNEGKSTFRGCTGTDSSAHSSCRLPNPSCRDFGSQMPSMDFCEGPSTTSHYICLSYFVHSKHCQGNGTNGSGKKHQKNLCWSVFVWKNMQICRTSEEEHLWIWHRVKDWRRFSIRHGQRKHWESLRAVLLTVALDFTAAAEPDSLSFTCFYYITYFLAAICL